MTDNSKYIIKNKYLKDVIPDQTVMLKKGFLRHLPGVKFQEEPIKPSSPAEEWYPYVNSYYPFTEDVDAFARVNHLLECADSEDSLEVKSERVNVNEYAERKAQRQYLRSKPICFLFLGKPGMGEEDVGKRLANYWKCVYIDPLTLLEEEIARGGRAGQCIEFNLRCGRAVGIDVLTRLLARKVQTPSVLHRGFVCCGFPLIPNDLYEEDPISSESAIFNVKEIFEELLDQTIRITDVSNKVVVSMVDSKEESEQLEGEEKSEAASEPIDESHLKMSVEWSIENQICGPTDISTDLEKQLNCLFGVFHEPFIIVYIYGKNSDVICKRDNYFYDVYSKDTVDMQKIKLFYEIGASNEYLTEDLFDAGRNPFAENPNLRHLVKTPENMPANVSTQLDRYHSEIANFIDCRILMHEHQYYIKLDGRAFISQMLSLIKLRLEVLPLQKVVLPKRFRSSSFELVGEGGEDETEIMTPQEAFLKYSKQDVVAPMFKWVWSDWGTLCPVSMFYGIYQNGSPDYAVSFLNKIYFLNDQDAFRKFDANPRPYLLPPFPKPGSRVFVFGPPVSGKSAVSKCFSYLLNATVLTPGEMHTRYFEQVVQEHTEKVKQVAIAEALEMLKEKNREEVERKNEEKKEKIAEWEAESVQALTQLKSILDLRSRESSLMLSSFPLKMERDEIERGSLDAETTLMQNLLDLNFPVIKNAEQCNEFLENRDALLEQLPPNLKAEIVEEAPSVLDPFVLDYADSKVQAIDLEEIKQEVKENIYEMYVRGIRACEEESEHEGWVIDGMTTDISLLKHVFEDFSIGDIVILYCSDYNFLSERFRKMKKNDLHFHNFREFFLGISEKDAAWRAPSAVSTDSYKREMAEDIISDVLKFDFEEDVIESDKEALAQQYDELLKVYQEEIENVKAYFEEVGVRPSFVDVKDLDIVDLLKDVINAIQDRYRRKASEFTDDDRAEEVQQFLSQAIPGGEGEGGGGQEADDFLARNRRYGDTYYYCPVTFGKRFVLWRGKEQYAAKFKEKVYLLANEANLKEFIRFPRKYLSQNQPPSMFPPPRVCMIGCGDRERSIVAEKLAKNLGVRYLNFHNIRRDAVNALSSVSLLVNSKDEEMPDAITLEWYDIVFKTIWFDEPYKYIGFVLDGFPCTAKDLNYMIFSQAIPDVIINLTMSMEDHLKRELDYSMNEWREVRDKHRKEEEVINSIIHQEWEDKRRARYNELMNEKRQNRYSKQMFPEDEEAPTPNPENESVELGFTSDTQISFDSVIEQQEHDEVLKILDEEFPEPVFEQVESEEEEEVIQKFSADIEEKYNAFMETAEEFKSICNTELIPFVELDAKQELEKIIIHAYIIGDELKFRGPSFFERCYDVSFDIADKLLSHGYFLLSTYGKICPVQYYSGHNPIHSYFAFQTKHEVYPVIHRSYIYFLNGKESRDMFCKNPLKYVTLKNLNFMLIPGIVAVIGPPKSGKTSLASRFRRDFGFRLVSRGEAVRYILAHPLYTRLQQELEDVLRKGDELPEELIVECINAASFCGESVTQGLIYDGFPNSITETTLLSRYGLVPHLIFDLQIGDERLYELASNPSDKYPLYSLRFVKHLLEEWKKSQELFRIWCDREYQTIYKLPVDRSIWGVWDQANEVTLSVMYERKHYFLHIKADWPLRLANMSVTPLEFLQRQSGYKTYCPACLFYSRRLKNGGDPPDRTGLVQYMTHFYWLCEKHIEEFLKTPEKFFPPSNVVLPQELPVVVHLDEPPLHPFEDGYCVVCYFKNFPRKVLVKGSDEFSVRYRDKIYLFDSIECLDEFMATPEELCYLKINFKEDHFTTSLEYKDLPVLGMLEQYVSRMIVRACNHVNFYRPVIPGLSISQSALICVGLNLKVHNTTNGQYQEKYEQALQLFHQRRTDLLRFLDLMKKYLNPTVYYIEPDTPSSTEEEEEEKESSPLLRIYSSRI